MLDPLIRDLSERYGLGDRSHELFGLLTAYIFNERRGGFPGFIEGFREQGHGKLVTSWINATGDLRTLNTSDVNMVFGQGLLADWGTRLGISRATVAAAIAGVLPQLVATLTPGGRIPGLGQLAMEEAQPEPAVFREDRAVAQPVPAAPPPPTTGDALRRKEPSVAAPATPTRTASTDPAEQRVAEMMSALGGSTEASNRSPSSTRPDNWRPAVHRPNAKRRGGMRWLLWLILLGAVVAGTFCAWQVSALDSLIAQVNPHLAQFNLWIPPRQPAL